MPSVAHLLVLHTLQSFPEQCFYSEHKTNNSTISRDGNLWRSKIWRLSLLYPPPPPTPEYQLTPPQTNWPSPQIMTWEWIRTLYQVLHELHSMKIYYDKIIFSVTKYLQKCPETIPRKNSNFGKLNFKLKHRKAQKLILSGRFGDLYGRAGEWCHIQKTPRQFRIVCICEIQIIQVTHWLLKKEVEVSN